MKIRNLLFDLGNVILPIDPQRVVSAFAQMGVPDFYQITQSNHHLFEQLETAALTPHEFRIALRNICGLSEKLSNQQIDSAWNTVFVFNELSRQHLFNCLALFNQLRAEGYRLFLFSNTNAIHFDQIREICHVWRVPGSQVNPYAPLHHYFDAEHYSHLIRERKPNQAGFLHILKKNQLNAKETLFVDDLRENVQGAQQLGMHGLHLDLSENMNIINHLKPAITELEGRSNPDESWNGLVSPQN